MKKAVLLLLNDIHVSKDNIPEFKANWREALEVCSQMGIGNIAFGGDMFQSRVSQTLDVLLAVYDALEDAARAGIYVTLAEGNHDLVNQEAVRGYCHIFAHHPNVAVVDDILTLCHPTWDFVLHMMSYFPEEGSFEGRLSALSACGMVEGKLNYLYIHEGINGAISTPCNNELPAHIFEPFDRVFVGHYHDRNVIGGTRIEYIGSSRQFNFGEDERKGYTILWSDGSHEFRCNLVNPTYRVIDVPVSEVDTSLFDRIEEVRSQGKIRLKVRIHADEASASTVDKAKLLEAGASKVEIIATDALIVQKSDEKLLEKFDARNLQTRYEDFCLQKGIQDTSLGLSYLSKIESSCGD